MFIFSEILLLNQKKKHQYNLYIWRKSWSEPCFSISYPSEPPRKYKLLLFLRLIYIQQKSENISSNTILANFSR